MTQTASPTSQVTLPSGHRLTLLTNLARVIIFDPTPHRFNRDDAGKATCYLTRQEAYVLLAILQDVDERLSVNRQDRCYQQRISIDRRSVFIAEIKDANHDRLRIEKTRTLTVDCVVVFIEDLPATLQALENYIEEYARYIATLNA